MNRRSFLMASAALIATPVIAADQTPAPDQVTAALAQGKTVFIDFTTEWCTTCAAQKRVIGSLLSQNPDYAANITFITVDFDDYRRHAFTKSLNIPRRSTLVVLKGDAELGRIVAGTSTNAIKGLLDTALAAAVAA